MEMEKCKKWKMEIENAKHLSAIDSGKGSDDGEQDAISTGGFKGSSVTNSAVSGSGFAVSGSDSWAKASCSRCSDSPSTNFSRTGDSTDETEESEKYFLM